MNRLFHLLRGESAASGAEYAVILAIIVAGLLLTVQIVGSQLDHSFSQVAGLNSVASGASARGEGDHASEPSVPSEATAERAWAFSTFNAVAMDVIIALCLGVILVAMLMRNKQPAPAEAETAPEKLIDEGSPLFAKRQAILKLLSSDVEHLLDSRLKVGAVMSTKVATALPRTSRLDVEAMMKKRSLRHLLVVDHHGKLIGMISDRDISNREGATAAEIMTRNPIHVESSALVSPTITLLLHKRISCLPVVDDGELKGVVTTTDLLMTLQCAMSALNQIADELQSASQTAQSMNDSVRISDVIRESSFRPEDLAV